MAIEDDVKTLETDLANLTEENARTKSALEKALDDIATLDARIREIQNAPLVLPELAEDVITVDDKFYRWWKDVAYAYYSSREPAY